MPPPKGGLASREFDDEACEKQVPFSSRYAVRAEDVGHRRRESVSFVPACIQGVKSCLTELPSPPFLGPHWTRQHGMEALKRRVQKYHVCISRFSIEEI